ncbi:MAG: LamG domain-containing protein [Tunicatimonas sp.]
MELIRIGEGYITKELEFSVGYYTVVDFIVLDEAETAIYLTPKAGSELASLINHPLPISFTVTTERTTDVTLEVVPANLGDPSLYGYATFSFDIVNTLQRGLTGYYQFDGDVNDASKHANHAIKSTKGMYADGVVGDALYFDGTDDYLTLENTLSLSEEFAFSFWVKSQGAANATENNGAVISKYSFNQRDFYITTYGYQDTRSENLIHASFFSAGNSNNRQRDWVNSNLSNTYLEDNQWDPARWKIASPDTLTKNAWTHVVVNMDSTTLSIYLDGKLNVQKQREYQAYHDSSQKTYIGNIFSGGEGNNNHFHGYLDELRIYERSLYPQEIKQLCSK